MAVVLAADDLTGQESRPFRTAAAAILGTAKLDLLGPDQNRDGAARSRPGGRVEWQAAEWSVGGVAIEEAGHQVGLADEARHGLVGGPGVQILRGGVLSDRAVIQHGDPVGDRQRLTLVVRD